MSTLRLAVRSLRPSMAFSRPLSTTLGLLASPGNANEHETNAEHRKYQTKKPLNLHITNTNSTIANELPVVGSGNPPPDLISLVDPDYSQKGDPENGSKAAQADLGVGELEGGKFKVKPLRRTGEDENTMRARLVCKYSSGSVYLIANFCLRPEPKTRDTRERSANVYIRRCPPTGHDSGPNDTV
jgi:hypothetical protein